MVFISNFLKYKAIFKFEVSYLSIFIFEIVGLYRYYFDNKIALSIVKLYEM